MIFDEQRISVKDKQIIKHTVVGVINYTGFFDCFSVY